MPEPLQIDLTYKGKTQTITVDLEPNNNFLGINLSRVAYFESSWPFVDMMKVAAKWISLTSKKSKDSRIVKIGINGSILLEPDQMARVMFQNQFPSGKYTFTYEGKGSLSFNNAGKVVQQDPGKILLEISPDDPRRMWIDVGKSDPNNPLRNIHFYMPNVDIAETFHPLFKESLNGFSTLRFMDWGRINGSPLVSWWQKTYPTDTFEGNSKGVSFEHMIDLADELGANPWLCVPHQADDEFVRKMAQLFKARLDPSRKIYLEYSNETWNWNFPQTNHVRDKGKELNLHPDGKEGASAHRYTAQRSVEIFKIWEQEFGGTDRLVRVMGSQAMNWNVSKQRLEWNDAYKYVDALAIAPYFKARNLSENPTINEVLTRCEEHINGQVSDAVVVQKEIADEFDVDLIGYEGGQHLVDRSGQLTNLYIEANRHPEMGSLIKKYLNIWKELTDSSLMCYYNHIDGPSKWGSWGALEYQDQPIDKAPKYQALKSFL